MVAVRFRMMVGKEATTFLLPFHLCVATLFALEVPHPFPCSALYGHSDLKSESGMNLPGTETSS